jgi:hypothetical protein
MASLSPRHRGRDSNCANGNRARSSPTHGRLRALQAPPRLPRQHQNFELRGRFFILSPVCSAASSRRPTMCWRRSRCRRGTSTASSRRTLPPPAPRLADGHERIEPTEGAGRPDRNPGLDGPVSRPDSLTTADPNAGPPAARWDRYPRRPLARLADPEIPLVGHVADRSAPDLDQLRGRAATKRSLQSLPCQAPLRHRPLGPLRDSTPDPAHDRSRAGGTRCCAAVRLAARLASREMQPG